MSAPITTLTQADSQLLPPLVITRLDSLAVTAITGDDRVSYLQGQTTCDLNQLGTNQYLLGAQCDFKGKMWSIFRIFADADQLLMLHSQASQTPAIVELKKFAAFAKAEISDQSDHWQRFGIAGANAASTLQQAFAALPDETQPLLRVENGYLLHIATPTPRYLLLLEQGSALPLPLQIAAEDSEQLWQLLDIEAGFPQLGGALIQQYVPQMLNLQALNGISFKKGCYIGQETVARMRYLGKNKRAMFLLAGQFADTVDTGTEIELAMDESWRRIGVVISAVTLNGQGKLLAVLPNDSREDAEFRIKDQPQSRLQLQPLPYPLESAGSSHT